MAKFTCSTLLVFLLLATPAFAMQLDPQTGQIVPGEKLQAVGAGKVIPDFGYGYEVGPGGQMLPKGGPDALDRNIERLRLEAAKPIPLYQ
jgi:hypothetical protein